MKVIQSPQNLAAEQSRRLEQLTPYKDGWILTYTGRRFYPLDPRPEDVCIGDITHALANICRFGGHSRWFYSVAQHSLIVSEEVPCLEALLHDATEAYVGDMVRPLKYALKDYCLIEDRIHAAIAVAFNLENSETLSLQIKNADNRALMTERRDVMAQSTHQWSLAKDFPPFEERIVPMSSEIAAAMFLGRFFQLKSQRSPRKLEGATQSH